MGFGILFFGVSVVFWFYCVDDVWFWFCFFVWRWLLLGVGRKVDRESVSCVWKVLKIWVGLYVVVYDVNWLGFLWVYLGSRREVGLL